ncbi:hypothetical protein AYO38_09840 [bacterium SCGC AG-212-C10]|nr:hypothetical protein AYO38_09840 [bacterium SCGC AG-212-C10]
MRLILVRHGQSEGNASGILQGRLDFGLTPLGQLQASHTADHLRSRTHVKRVVSSPLLRAKQTAGPIAEALGIELELDPALAEYDMGEASGLTGAELRERFPDVMSSWERGVRPSFPGEEGRDIFRQRVDGFFQRLLADGRDTIAIGHGGVVNLACHIVLGMDYGNRPGVFSAGNCSLTEFASDRTGRLVLLHHNDDCHIRELATTLDLG